MQTFRGEFRYRNFLSPRESDNGGFQWDTTQHAYNMQLAE